MKLPAAFLRELAAALESAPRMGADCDRPEGARYIMVSDTAAQNLAESLRMIAENV